MKQVIEMPSEGQFVAVYSYNDKLLSFALFGTL